MKAFFNLSQREQIIRLRKLANVALQQYDIGEVSLRFLSNTDNAVFRVDWTTEKSQQIENPNASRRYILRITRPEKYPSEMIRAEFYGCLPYGLRQIWLSLNLCWPLTEHLFRKYLLLVCLNRDTVFYSDGSMDAFGITIC